MIEGGDLRGSLWARRARLAAWWAVPPLLCLTLHWLSFRAWFRGDDFGWFGRALTVYSWDDLPRALFAPAAQGTIRPWSERIFFMGGLALFGLDSLPFRIVIFATMFADLALLAAIGRRLGGSALAGFCAAVFWTINATLLEPLGWACVYNQVMCGFFLLLALYLLIRYTETGERRFNYWQWAVFLIGFGAQELNLVYPAIAAGYTWLCARKYFRGALAMVPVSAAYALMHQAVAPAPKEGIYAMHFDASIFSTLKTYWLWAWSAPYLDSPNLPKWAMRDGVYLVTLGLLIFLIRHRRDGRAWFCLLWALAAIAPVLPLRDHITEYYPCLGMIGICWLGGWAFAQARGRLRVPAVLLAALYAFLAVPHLLEATGWNFDLTERARNLTEGLASVERQHPGKALILYGVDGDLFWNAIRDRSYRLVGIDRLYVSAEDARRIAAHPEWGDIDQYVLPGVAIARGLARGELLVYDVRGPRLRNITSIYAALPHERTLPASVDPADPLIAELLGPEWYSVDGNHRWMPARATLRLAGPAHPGERLFLRGNCAAEELRGGPLTITVTVDGSRLPPSKIDDTGFELALPLPPAEVGKPEMSVAVAVDRTFRPSGESRDLGLAFGEIAVR
jgi:hypothetical protein